MRNAAAARERASRRRRARRRRAHARARRRASCASASSRSGRASFSSCANRSATSGEPAISALVRFRPLTPAAFTSRSRSSGVARSVAVAAVASASTRTTLAVGVQTRPSAQALDVHGEARPGEAREQVARGRRRRDLAIEPRSSSAQTSRASGIPKGRSDDVAEESSSPEARAGSLSSDKPCVIRMEVKAESRRAARRFRPSGCSTRSARNRRAPSCPSACPDRDGGESTPRGSDSSRSRSRASSPSRGSTCNE